MNYANQHTEPTNQSVRQTTNKQPSGFRVALGVVLAIKKGRKRPFFNRQ